MPKTKLTAKQRRFVGEYLVDLNATQAAIRAGYSKRTAKEQGYRLLTKVHIQAAIQIEQDAIRHRNRLSVDEVIQGLRDAAQLAREQKNPAAAISAYSWLGRHLGMFTDRVRQEVDQQVSIKKVFVSWGSDAK